MTMLDFTSRVAREMYEAEAVLLRRAGIIINHASPKVPK